MTKEMKLKLIGIMGLALLLMTETLAGASKPAGPSVKQVKADMKRVADWQIEHFGDVYDTKHRKRPYELGEWTTGALYVGMVQWAEIADDDTYFEWLKDIGQRQDWRLRQDRFFYADDHCVGQLYMSLYKKYGDPAMITPTQTQFNQIMANPPAVELAWKNNDAYDRWSWCDSLFMAPPVWAKLSSVTGDPTYRDWMFGEYRATTEYLFDLDEHLYFRDNRFFEQRHNGKKIFWSRGNGWVFGGLALILQEIPKPSAQYDYFEGLYKQMAEKIATLQTPQGYWAMSLLEADTYPTPETSGTGFYCFGLAWGINNGVLDRSVYEPVVLKAWDALTRCVTDEGMLGYVQPIGAEPGQAWPDRTEVYGTGAFLAAGAEVCRMLDH